MPAQGPGRVGKERQVPRSLYGYGQPTLVLCAGSGLAARLDLALIRQKPRQEVGFLVVDASLLFGAEGADFVPASPSPLVWASGPPPVGGAVPISAIAPRRPILRWP